MRFQTSEQLIVNSHDYVVLHTAPHHPSQPNPTHSTTVLNPSTDGFCYSTSCWRPGQIVFASSYTLELFVSQSCEEFSGRACDQYHHESFEHQDGDDRRARSKEQGNKRTMRTKQGATDKYEVSSHLAITSARASVTSSNSVCSPSNNPLHSSSCVHKFSPWRNHLSAKIT